MLWHLHCSLPKGLYTWDGFIGETFTQSLHEKGKLSQVYFIVQLIFNTLLTEIGNATETSSLVVRRVRMQTFIWGISEVQVT